jgi:membrane-associated phospholipid phosphatase
MLRWVRSFWKRQSTGPNPAPRSRRTPGVEQLEDRQLLSGGLSIAGKARPARPDAVIFWDRALLDAIRTDKTPPPKAARAMAMVSLAVYDAVEAIERKHPLYMIRASAPPGTSESAAASTAAFIVLESLFPAQQAKFQDELRQALRAVPRGTAKAQGMGLGMDVALKILALRGNDGSQTTVTYTPGSAPGQWVPTPPGFAAALLPNWGNVTPFALRRGNQFRPAGPPALTSTAYAAAFNEVMSLGSATSTTRTAEQTQIAQFWADGSGTETPPGHWNEIAQNVALSRHNTLEENARMFALLNMALADAGIASWDAKYATNFWRPVTAIQNADLDGNAATAKDASWTPLLVTPPFPTYISGHSTFSAAAAAVLTKLFGNHVHFSSSSDALPGVQRTFTSFLQAAQEAGQSRIYGGIHFQFDNQDGLATGTAVGTWVVRHFLK